MIVGGEYKCSIQHNLACCKDDCPFCSNCGNLTSLSYWDFKENCCADIIMNSYSYCNETVAPCILADQSNNLQRIINFFKTGPLNIVIPVSVTIGLVVLFFLYSCCFFGSKKPPEKYKYIRPNCLNELH